MKNEDLFQRTLEALKEIRPFLKEDGGDLELIEITGENVARIELKGTCTNCSMNTMTFKSGVQDAIMKAVPEIKGVEAVNFALN
ncbi:MAG: hypothetical protein CL843_02515 [Crocinitomicaceae bacterium]|nr:hypothetical protein [Crocinitomicaceae bacterium]|tara:strand:- start:782 stop:1033 length:252 start_codon:yes stop_codon:yes gene_type:complete